MPAGAPGRRPAGRRCRCSMSITRCGSGRSWVIWPTATARSPRSWPTGSRPWPGCPSGWCCPPIGPIRRWPITAAPGWRWTGRRSCSSRLPGWLVSTTRPVSWWCRPPWRCCWPRSAPARRWRWGSRSPGGATRRSMSWWGFSSTPWCCGSRWPVIPVSPSCWPRCAGAPWPPTSIKTCPSRCWWIGSTRPDR